MDVAEKIRSRIVVDDQGCWVWQGAKTWKGYGVVHSDRRNTYTHRAMYETASGPIPPGHQIDHLCRNPACCNPAHLEAVTPAENTRRGKSREAASARKDSASHCPHGHEYTEANSYRDADGYRSCRSCRSERHAEWAEKRREKSVGYRTFTAEGGNVASIARGLSA